MRNDHGGSRQTRSFRKHQHSPGHSTRREYAPSSLESSLIMSSIRHQRRRHGSDILQWELRKIKPPSFDGEKKKGEDAEAWLLGMRKIF